MCVCAPELFGGVQSLGAFSGCDLICLPCLYFSSAAVAPAFLVWDHFQNETKQKKTNNAESGAHCHVSDVSS